MGDARTVQQGHLSPDGGQDGIGHLLRLEIDQEPETRRPPQHQQRGIGSSPAHEHHGRYPDPCRAGQQRHARLVLNLLDPGHLECGDGILVHRETPDLGQQLSVEFVAPDDFHDQRSNAVTTFEDGGFRPLLRRQADGGSGNADIRQDGFELRCRGTAARRPEQQVDQRRHPPAHRQRTQHVNGKGGPDVQGGQEEHRHQHLPATAYRSADVRGRRRHHGYDDGNAHWGEVGRDPQMGQGAQAASETGVADHIGAQDPGDTPRQRSRQRQVPG